MTTDYCLTAKERLVKPNPKHLGVASSAALILLLISAVLAPSQAAAAEGQSPPNGPVYCNILLDKETDRNGNSIVLAEVCSSASSDSAKRNFDEQVARIQRSTVTPMASTQLMTWWSDSTGSSGAGNSTTIYGSSGICDSTGYTITPNTYWKNNMSAVVGYTYCNRMKFRDVSLGAWSVNYVSPAYYLGPYNDNVGQMRIFCQNISGC